MNYNQHQFYDRFKLIVSDPLNKNIVKNNPTVLFDNIIEMYNGVLVGKDSYYGNFSDILLLNDGVHEPSEEYLFQKVLDNIVSESPTMIELGSYWAFYSLSFLNRFKKGKTYCIEMGEKEYQSGVQNFALNNKSGFFLQGEISERALTVDDFVIAQKLNHIDILHSDIQGFEIEMLFGAVKTLSERKVDYLFISTHSDYLHHKCLEFLHHIEYGIIAEVNVSETFCEDGIILAINPNISFDKISLPRRSQHQIISSDYLDNLFKTKI